ncbi:hypothetical protein F971_03387, partial [Acinetobacter vivianii]
LENLKKYWLYLANVRHRVDDLEI